MTTVAMEEKPARRATRQRFYLILSLLMAVVIIAGFSTTVPSDFAAPPKNLPLLLHIHGAVFTLWVLLFVAQPSFIARGSVKLHRQIGWLGAGLAAAMVVMGLAATLFSIRFHLVPSFFPTGVFLVMNGVGILVFGGLVAGGIALRRKADWHKRLMICATASILGPGVGRLMALLDLGALTPLFIFGLVDLFAISGAVFDLTDRKRIHPAYYWGVGAIVASELIIGPLAFAPPTAALIHLIRG